MDLRKENLELLIQKIRQELKKQGKILRVKWSDEYGSPQQLTLSDFDHIEIAPR